MEDFTILWDDPGWLIGLKALGVFVFLVLTTLLTIWGERRVVARMQMRVGPNRVGPFGLLQGLADGIKLAFKEDLLPTAAHKAVFILAPIISTICAFLAFAVIPMGGEVSIFGEPTLLQLTDFPVAVLFVVAIASIGIYGIVLAGWSSGSTYPLLGGLRSSAQMISYEIAMGLSFVAVFLYAGTMSTGGIVEAQERLWFAIILAPWPITAVWDGANAGWWPLVWFLVKLGGFIFFFIWLRGTLPRLRYDQFMSFGWKVLIPVSLGWIVVVSGVRALDLEGADASTWLIAAAIVAVGLLAVSFALDARDSGREAADLAAAAVEPEPEPEPGDAGYAGHPVPPMHSAVPGSAADDEELEVTHG